MGGTEPYEHETLETLDTHLPAVLWYMGVPSQTGIA
jgi:hypothetical protein